ncbi:MAG: DNA (cytosine-5-)-methyltransferase [Candidatus Thorarchaeota archaeon]|nr:DNA (cytosine-5-)-methyltransferase [Candidatus Thorarchaeota archaeon]
MTVSKFAQSALHDSFLYNHVSAKLSKLDLQMIQSIPQGGNWQDIPLSVANQSARVMKIRASGGRTTYYGRLNPSLPSYTINTYFNRPGNGTFIHPIQDRLISFREAARLQSFPDWYRFKGSNTSIYKQIGNAVPPLLARAIGLLFKKSLTIDVFAGAGGLSLGLQDSNHKILAAADINTHMRQTYSENHPDTIVLDVDFSNPIQFESFIERIENELRGRSLGLLAGGPPCQGFSTAGKWSIADPRNQLVFSMLRIVKHLQPEHVLIENVVGLRIQKNGKTLLAIQENLESLGYRSEWFQLNAEQYGVPQRRRRVFIHASRSDGLVGPPTPLFSMVGRKKNGIEPGLDTSDLANPIIVQDAIGDLPSIPSGGGMHTIDYDNTWITSSYQQYIRNQIPFRDLVMNQSG